MASVLESSLKGYLDICLNTYYSICNYHIGLFCYNQKCICLNGTYYDTTTLNCGIYINNNQLLN